MAKSNITKSFQTKSTLRAYSEGGFVNSLRNAMGMGNNAARKSRIDAAVDAASGAPPQPAIQPAPATPPPAPTQQQPVSKPFRFADGGVLRKIGDMADGLQQSAQSAGFDPVQKMKNYATGFVSGDPVKTLDSAAMTAVANPVASLSPLGTAAATAGGAWMTGRKIGQALPDSFNNDLGRVVNTGMRKLGLGGVDDSALRASERKSVLRNPAEGSAFGMEDGGYIEDKLDIPAYKGGGHVKGKGGPRSDKVGPVMLSDGEYVLPAKTVKAVGGPQHIDKVVQATNDGRKPGAKPVPGGKMGAADGDYADRLRKMGQKVGKGVGDAAIKSGEWIVNKAAPAVADATVSAAEGAIDLGGKAYNAGVQGAQDAYQAARTATPKSAGQATGEAIRAAREGVTRAAQAGQEFADAAARAAQTPQEAAARFGNQASKLRPSMVSGESSTMRTVGGPQGAGQLSENAAAARLRQLGVTATEEAVPKAAAKAAAAAGGETAATRGFLARTLNPNLSVKGIAKAGLAAAPVIGAYTAAQADDPTRKGFAESVGGDNGPNFGTEALRYLKNVGDAATFGQATRVGNWLAGNGYNDNTVDVQAADRIRAQTPKAASVTPGEPEKTSAVPFSDARFEAAAGRSEPATPQNDLHSKLRQLAIQLRPDLGDENNVIGQLSRNEYVGAGNGTPMAPNGIRFASDADIARMRNQPEEVGGVFGIKSEGPYPILEAALARQGGGNAQGRMDDQIREMTRFKPSVGANIIAQNRRSDADIAQRASDSALRAQTAQQGTLADIYRTDVMDRGNQRNVAASMYGHDVSAANNRASIQSELYKSMLGQQNKDRDFNYQMAKDKYDRLSSSEKTAHDRAVASVERTMNFAEKAFQKPDGSGPDLATSNKFQRAFMASMHNFVGGESPEEARQIFTNMDPESQQNAIAQAVFAFQNLQAGGGGNMFTGAQSSALPNYRQKAPEISDITRGAPVTDYLGSKLRELAGVGDPNMVVDENTGQVRAARRVYEDDATRRQMLGPRGR